MTTKYAAMPVKEEQEASTDYFGEDDDDIDWDSIPIPDFETTENIGSTLEVRSGTDNTNPSSLKLSKPDSKRTNESENGLDESTNPISVTQPIEQVSKLLEHVSQTNNPCCPQSKYKESLLHSPFKSPKRALDTTRVCGFEFKFSPESPPNPYLNAQTEGSPHTMVNQQSTDNQVSEINAGNVSFSFNYSTAKEPPKVLTDRIDSCGLPNTCKRPRNPYLKTNLISINATTTKVAVSEQDSSHETSTNKDPYTKRSFPGSPHNPYLSKQSQENKSNFTPGPNFFPGYALNETSFFQDAKLTTKIPPVPTTSIDIPTNPHLKQPKQSSITERYISPETGFIYHEPGRDPNTCSSASSIPVRKPDSSTTTLKIPLLKLQVKSIEPIAPVEPVELIAHIELFAPIAPIAPIEPLNECKQTSCVPSPSIVNPYKGKSNLVGSKPLHSHSKAQKPGETSKPSQALKCAGVKRQLDMHTEELKALHACTENSFNQIPSSETVSSKISSASIRSVSNRSITSEASSRPPLVDRPVEWTNQKGLDIIKEPDSQSVQVNSSLESLKPSVPSTIRDYLGNVLPALPVDLAYDSSRIQPVDDEHREALVSNANVDQKLKNGWSLLPHQKKAVLRGIQFRRLILAYDMGLGKTLISCIWANAFLKTFLGLKVFVIAPISLQNDWLKTARECTDIFAPAVKDESDVDDNSSSSDSDSDESETQKMERRKKRLMRKKPKKKITGQALKAEIKKHQKKRLETQKIQDNRRFEVYSWGKLPCIPAKDEIKEYVVICDEAHSMQSMDAKRTKDALKLLKAKQCIGCLLLTGTPMKNGKPSNLFPLLNGIRHPLADRQRKFEVFFCNGHDKNYGAKTVWDANGSSNLELLNAHISSHMLYMSKEEALKDLPSRRREYRTVPCSSAFEVKHRQALSELGKAMDYCANKDSEVLLAAFSRVRLVAALAKVAGTVSMAKEILQKEPAIVIFTSFVDVAKSVHRMLGESGWKGVLLTGETPKNQRSQLVEDFQAGLMSVFVCTFGAGGVGLTLTAARTIILLDRPWTPGDAAQAEDRVRRIGQDKQVISIWVRCFDVDKQIDDLIEQKQSTSNAVVDTRRTGKTSNEAKVAPKLSLFQLVRSIIKDNSQGS